VLAWAGTVGAGARFVSLPRMFALHKVCALALLSGV
jgi:hypothetical protein